MFFIKQQFLQLADQLTAITQVAKKIGEANVYNPEDWQRVKDRVVEFDMSLKKSFITRIASFIPGTQTFAQRRQVANMLATVRNELHVMYIDYNKKLDDQIAFRKAFKAFRFVQSGSYAPHRDSRFHPPRLSKSAPELRHPEEMDSPYTVSNTFADNRYRFLNKPSKTVKDTVDPWFINKPVRRQPGI